MDIGEQERVIMVEPIPVEMPHEVPAYPEPAPAPAATPEPEPARFTERSSKW